MSNAYTDENLRNIYAEWQKSKLSQKKYCEINRNESEVFPTRI